MMGKVFRLLAVVLLSLAAASRSGAKELILAPQSVCAIVAPADSRDTRTLVYFELPKELYGEMVEIDNVFLIFRAEVADADFGMVEVFPVTTDWRSAGSVSWSSPWDSIGGDYSTDIVGSSVTLRKQQGDKEMRLNVTFIVKAWLDRVLPNKGIIMKLSQADLRNTFGRLCVNTELMKLRITF